MEHLTEQLRDEYDNRLPHFTRNCKNTVEALQMFLNDHKIPYLAISYRVKEFESFLEKVNRKQYRDPFLDNEDFCGVRIIVYNLFDIEKIKEIILAEFDVKEEKDKSEHLDLNEFGYRSFHFVVGVKNAWLASPQYRGLNNVKTEIQVRTVLMHAWAEIEHKLGYKNKEQVPNELKRRLFMLSAKLEEADGQFQELTNRILSYTQEIIDSANKTGSVAFEDLNLNSLQALLDFHFPEFKNHPSLTGNLLRQINGYKLSLSELNNLAKRFKPLIPFLESKLNARSGDGLMQFNIMSYAIEVFFEGANYNHGSKGRKNIISYLKQVAMEMSI